MTWWLSYLEGWVYLIYRTETFKSKMHSPSSSGAMTLWTSLFPAMREKEDCCAGRINFSANYISKFTVQLCRAALIYLHPSLAPTLSLPALVTIDCALLFWDKDTANFKQRKLQLTVIWLLQQHCVLHQNEIKICTHSTPAFGCGKTMLPIIQVNPVLCLEVPHFHIYRGLILMGKVRQWLSNTGVVLCDDYEVNDVNTWAQGEDTAGGGQGKRRLWESRLGLCCSRVLLQRVSAGWEKPTSSWTTALSVQYRSSCSCLCILSLNLHTPFSWSLMHEDQMLRSWCVGTAE